MKIIELTKGYVAIVDDKDYRVLIRHKWQSCRGKYAKAAIKNQDGKWVTVFMHRMILDLYDPNVHCDHIDGNGLDNRRSNLRSCNRNENARNQKKRIDNTSGFKGVCFNKLANKWQASITVDNKAIYLGLFDFREKAYESYKEASLKLHGKFARFS